MYGKMQAAGVPEGAMSKTRRTIKRPAKTGRVKVAEARSAARAVKNGRAAQANKQPAASRG